VDDRLQSEIVLVGEVQDDFFPVSFGATST
jgi:hypothetical protein